MDRRLFVTGLLGVAGTAGIAAVLPGRAEALAAVPMGGPAPKSDTLLPELPKLPESQGLSGEVDDGWELDDGEEQEGGFQLAHRRVRRRRWRRRCRRWWHHGHSHRRCRRVPFWIWISI